MPEHIARVETPDGTVTPAHPGTFSRYQSSKEAGHETMPELVAKIVTPARPGTFSRYQSSKEAGHETMPELIVRTVTPARPWNLFTVSVV